MLKWANDNNGYPVHIDDPKVRRHELKPFRCRICNQELIAKPKGVERSPHFAHKGDYQHNPGSTFSKHAQCYG